MTGITASAVTDSDEDAILEGIAACSDDISSGHLEITSIADLSSRRRRALLEDSTGIDIEYTTEVTLEQTAYTNAHSLFKVPFFKPIGRCTPIAMLTPNPHKHSRKWPAKSLRQCTVEPCR